jgi:hypothetical protein
MAFAYGGVQTKRRNGYSITLVEPADLSAVNDDDLETLTRQYAAHCEKEQRKREQQRQRLLLPIDQRRERQDVIPSDYGHQRCRELVQEKYGIIPLRNRFSEE